MLERGSNAWVDVVAAPLASKGTATCDPVEFGSDYSANWAGRFVAVTALDDAIQASLIVWVLRLKLLEGVFHD